MATKRKKAGKRPRGEGSVTLRKDGRWQTSMTLENRERKYFYGDTQAEALEKLHVAQQQQKHGKLATGPQQTVKQFLDDWLENVHRHEIRDNTYTMYRQLLDNHILPAFGHVQLRKLTAHQLDVFYANKLKAKYAPQTIRLMHQLLRTAFGDAVRWKRISNNICEEAKPPKVGKRVHQVLTKQQAHILIQAAKGTELEALIPLALASGMRQGELLGLKWRDINTEEKILSIERIVYRVKKKGIVEADPKTEKSKSTIELPQFVIDALLLHRSRLPEMRMKAGKKSQENDIVFCNQVGKFMEASNTRLRFKELLKKAGLPDMPFHGLRHSAATILLAMGVHPKQVQELLRHSNIATTMDIYSHVLPSMQRKMMDDLNTFFEE